MVKALGHGQYIAINVESEDYELADDADAACDALYSRHLDAQILVERVGSPAVFIAPARRRRRRT